MKIGIVAGEPSGDLLGCQLIRSLKAYIPELEFVGIAGPRMQAAGAVSWFPMDKLAVRGILEVLRHLWEILAIRRRLARRFIDEPPQLFIGIDAPDFTLGLEAKLRAAGIPTVHYVSPSIWMWRRERIEKIRSAVAKVLCLFPFEPELYRAAGIAAAYVGHPLADMIPDAIDRNNARAQLRLSAEGTIVALLPGSRQGELEYHAALYVECARRLAEAIPEVRFLVPLATRETRAQFEAAVHRAGAGDLRLTILFGHAQDAMAAADVALVASGTATLEAALLKCPMVITYRVSNATYRMVKRKAYLPYGGLPNILAGEFIVPELLQDDASADNIAMALLNLLRHERARVRLDMRYRQIHRMLRQDTATRLVEALSEFIPALASREAARALPQDAHVAA